jgi:hypothetical protein
MSAPELPDDPRDWPSDPFTLLGVRPGTPEADIKRAYARLIRRFKPEHAPEQFRRIRAAYETCLEFARHFFPPPDAPGDFRPPVIIRVDRPEPPAEVPRSKREPAPPEPAPLEQPPPRRVDAADRLWAAAVEGRHAEAYAGLAGLAGERRESPDVPLRLYWLLAVNPSLDADRTRHDWLVEALVRARLRGAAAELYRRELEAEPQAALYRPYIELMSAPAETADLLTVVRWRLAAAGRAAMWGPAHIDLWAVRERLATHDEAAWLGLVVTALDWAVWDRPEPLYGSCREELGRLRHLELRYGSEFDRVDEGEYLAAGWRGFEVQNLPSAIRELLRRAWAGGSGMRPADVLPSASVIAAHPVPNIDRFDRAFQTQRSEVLMALLLRILQSYRRPDEPEDEPAYPPELLRGAFQAWAARRPTEYPRLRSYLPEFLAAEVVGPLELAEACAADPDSRLRQLAWELRKDQSLQLVWAAIRIRQG